MDSHVYLPFHFIVFNFSDGIKCFCTVCNIEKLNDTCQLRGERAKCFVSVDLKYESDGTAYELYTYGCLGPQEDAYMQVCISKQEVHVEENLRLW